MITGNDISASRLPDDQALADQIARAVVVFGVSEDDMVAVGREVFSLRLWPALDHVSFSVWRDSGETYRLKWAPTFRGMLELCHRSPELAYVEPVLVLSEDEFSYEDGVVHHRYNPLDERVATPDNIRGGYVRIVYRDGRPARYHFVSRAKILKNRSCAKRDKVWESWFHEMALKTLIRDAFCRGSLPMMHAVVSAIRAEDDFIGNDPDGPSMNGYHKRIEEAVSVAALEDILEAIISDKSISADVRRKLTKAVRDKHQEMSFSVPQNTEEAERILESMTDIEEIRDYGKKLLDMGAPSHVVDLARERYRAVARGNIGD